MLPGALRSQPFQHSTQRRYSSPCRTMMWIQHPYINNAKDFLRALCQQFIGPPRSGLSRRKGGIAIVTRDNAAALCFQGFFDHFRGGRQQARVHIVP